MVIGTVFQLSDVLLNYSNRHVFCFLVTTLIDLRKTKGDETDTFIVFWTWQYKLGTSKGHQDVWFDLVWCILCVVLSYVSTMQCRFVIWLFNSVLLTTYIQFTSPWRNIMVYFSQKKYIMVYHIFINSYIPSHVICGKSWTTINLFHHDKRHHILTWHVWLYLMPAHHIYQSHVNLSIKPIKLIKSWTTIIFFHIINISPLEISRSNLVLASTVFLFSMILYFSCSQQGAFKKEEKPHEDWLTVK